MMRNEKLTEVYINHQAQQQREHQAQLARDSAARYNDDEEKNKSKPVHHDDESLGIITGVVKRFGDYDKPGYGHIKGPNNEEYFVHYTDISTSGFKNLASGQHVRFRGYMGDKGLYAKEVRVFS